MMNGMGAEVLLSEVSSAFGENDEGQTQISPL